MSCSKCRKKGHNVRTCPLLDNPSHQQESIDAATEVDNCPICMEGINDTNCCTTKCGHKFCLECFVKHSKIKDNCPMCRREFYFNKSSRTTEQPQNRIMNFLNTTDQIYVVCYYEFGSEDGMHIYKCATIRPNHNYLQHASEDCPHFILFPIDVFEDIERWDENDDSRYLIPRHKYADDRRRGDISYSGPGLYVIHDDGIEYNSN